MRIPMYRGKWRMQGGWIEGYLCYTSGRNEVGLQTIETRGIVKVLPETVVEYNAGKMGFVFRNLLNQAIVPGYAIAAATKVVGNVVENPELLRVKRLRSNLKTEKRRRRASDVPGST